jgi:ATP-dependent Lon protease
MIETTKILGSSRISVKSYNFLVEMAKSHGEVSLAKEQKRMIKYAEINRSFYDEAIREIDVRLKEDRIELKKTRNKTRKEAFLKDKISELQKELEDIRQDKLLL